MRHNGGPDTRRGSHDSLHDREQTTIVPSANPRCATRTAILVHLKAGIRSRDLASEIQETFQPTLREGKPALQRAPGRPLNPLEPLRNFSQARGQPSPRRGVAGEGGAPAGEVVDGLCATLRNHPRRNRRQNSNQQPRLAPRSAVRRPASLGLRSSSSPAERTPPPHHICHPLLDAGRVPVICMSIIIRN